jgi:tetratricopeptide (TPR) repeat protein
MQALTFNYLIAGTALALLAGCASAPPPPPLRSTPPAAAAAPAPVPQAAAQPAPAMAPAAPARPKATGTPEDARRHLVRGVAAIEIAKSADDLALAADEFRKATEIAPEMASAWYNLGSVQAKTGQVNEAIASYRRYLALSPDAADAQKVADEIIKLEFRQERTTKEQASSGIWVESDGSAYYLQVNGSKWQLATKERPLVYDVENYYGPGVGSYGFAATELGQVTFNLELRGKQLAGTWQRADVMVDECSVPAETGDVKGELDAAHGLLVLEFNKAYYKTYTSAPFPISFETKDKCREVSVLARRDARFVFLGPLPAAGVGAYVTTAHGITGRQDWVGELRVRSTVKGSPAEQAGLYYEDLIVAIDGVPVKSLSAGEAMWRLRGEPGSTVQLTIQRPKVKAPVTVTVRRAVLPPPPPFKEGGAIPY